MSHLVVSTRIDAPPAAVWADVEDISTHVRWMADAESIVFTSEQASGVGTTFDCRTRIGPIALTDRMEITAWEPGRRMGVRHSGIVTGSGEFRLEPLDGGSATQFTWEEDLRFPTWSGGPVAAAVATPVMRAVWRGNVARLRDMVESGIRS